MLYYDKLFIEMICIFSYRICVETTLAQNHLRLLFYYIKFFVHFNDVWPLLSMPTYLLTMSICFKRQALDIDVAENMVYYVDTSLKKIHRALIPRSPGELSHTQV